MTPPRARGAALAALALALACACAPARVPGPEPDARVGDGRYAMGTVLEIELVGPDRGLLERELDALYAEVEALEGALSTWRPESELSRLNRAAGGAALALSEPARDLLLRSVALSRETGGRFDVTLGPLVALWREAARRGRLPSAAELSAARARVGPDQLEFGAGGRVALRSAGAAVEVGGIAKGYALDRLAERLRARGITRALLDFGGSSVWALGAPPGAAGWRLFARDAGGAPLGVLTLRDQALSVSASLGQSSEIEGRSRGHVIDPRSGEALGRALQAIAIADEAARAEAFSKAFLIAGAEQAPELARRAGSCEALLAGAGEILFETAGFAAAARLERLKPGASGADPARVPDLPCPVCSADIDTTGARIGEEVFCSYCGAPARVVRRASSEDESEFDLEEEY